MTWDITQPTNTTKIRNLGVVIRPNWQAVESADLSFQPNATIFTDRNPLGVANDPPPAVENGTSRGNGYTVYCKQDSSGNQSLYGIDPSGVISQFTDSDISLTQTGYAILPPGILFHWGRSTIVNATSVIAVLFNAGGGPNYGSTPFMVSVTPYANIFPASASNHGSVGARSITTTGFDVICFNRTVGTNVPCGWMAIGLL